MTSWILVKSTLCHTDQLVIAFDRPLRNSEGAGEKLLDGARAIAFKPDNPDMFLVGTEEGHIHLATVEYASEYVASYYGHTMPINRLAWNPFLPDIFVSCAAEALVLVWHREVPTPIMRYLTHLHLHLHLYLHLHLHLHLLLPQVQP